MHIIFVTAFLKQTFTIKALPKYQFGSRESRCTFA